MRRPTIVSIVFALLTILLAGESAVFGQNSSELRVFLLDLKAEDRGKAAANLDIRKIDNDAKKALAERVDPITTKQATPPSKDKHDYMSQAPYFWRNPNTPTGFPYIRRDGERNPEIKQYPDHDLLDKMVSA